MPRLNPLEYVRSGINEGLSARAAYREMQAEASRLSEETGLRWTGIRLYTFQQVYAGLRYTKGQIPEAINAPKDLPGGGLTISSRPSTIKGGYLHAGAAFTRQRGASTLERTVHMFRSDQLLTPAQIEERIREQIEETPPYEGSIFNGVTIEAITFTGVQELTGGLHA